jgi:hypothetical protein
MSVSILSTLPWAGDHGGNPNSMDAMHHLPNGIYSIESLRFKKQFFGSSQLSQFMDQSNPLSECSYHYLGESRHFSIDHMRYADLVVELYKGELRIIKNRYDESGGTLELSPDEMAKMLLAHN